VTISIFSKYLTMKWHAGEGTGLLRLHSTYRHDLKIYSSDEGRVQVQIYAFSSEDEHMIFNC
jgi:hypothetical protein